MVRSGSQWYAVSVHDSLTWLRAKTKLIDFLFQVTLRTKHLVSEEKQGKATKGFDLVELLVYEDRDAGQCHKRRSTEEDGGSAMSGNVPEPTAVIVREYRLSLEQTICQFHVASPYLGSDWKPAGMVMAAKWQVSH